MQQIFTLLLVIGSLSATDSSSVVQVETVPTPTEKRINVNALVAFVAKKLVSQELTFDSQVPGEVVEVFTAGICGAHTMLSSNPERIHHLSLLDAKAKELYGEGRLTSRWLMYLSLCCAELLSDDQVSVSYLTLGGINTQEGFNRFTYLHDNRVALRDRLN